MKMDILMYVKGCVECQRMKINTRPMKAPLQPLFPKPEAYPFEVVTMDLITKLPISQGYDSILTGTDHDCTKVAVLIPCKEEATAEDIAALYVKYVFVQFGLPTKFISDRDPRFVSKFMRELCKILGIQQNISTAFHPRTDGQSERTNQWVEQYLRFFINNNHDDWVHYLPLVEFVHNNWVSEMTKQSPFFLLSGYNPRADWVDQPSPIPQVALRLSQFKTIRNQAQQAMTKAQKLWVKHCDSPRYKIGDQVWLEGKNLQLHYPTKKFRARRYGPFKVEKGMSPVNYKLELPMQWTIHPMFHTDLLTPYQETEIHRENYSCPAPEMIDDQEEYVVERIIDSRRHGHGRKLQYLVKWEGYPDSDNQWIGKDDVFADEAVWEFKLRNPRKEVHIRGPPKATSTSSSLPTTIRHMYSSTAQYALYNASNTA